MRNFNVPYFSRDIAEFWRRWHISLTTWFRDYVYIPLGGSRPEVPARLKAKGERIEARYKKAIAIRNTFVIFLLSGFWHGANWTFVLWGAYHALLFVPLLLMNKNRRYRDTVATITLPDGTTKTKLLPSFKETGQMLLTFSLAVFGWIIFRATGLKTLSAWISGICDSSLLSLPYLMDEYYYIPLVISILVMVVLEWINRTKEHSFQITIKYKWLRWIVYLLFILIIFFSMKIDTPQFIYFQF